MAPPLATGGFRTYNVVVLCSGLGGIDLGYLMAEHPTARFEVIGSFDVDKKVKRAHERLIGRKQTTLDLFSEEQYIAYHGKMPPAGWREATGEDLRRACGGRRPHVVATSSPCQGLSGLLSNESAKARKYQALNRLTIRCIQLLLDAWGDDPPEHIIFENVPRIATRGRPLLDIIQGLLTDAGYAYNETNYDCGEFGGLAQSRRRFLMVTRNKKKVPAMLWVPQIKALRPIRDVLYRLPLPDDTVAGGQMHKVSRLQWKTWLRLALIPPGQDWRALRDLEVDKYRLVPEQVWHNGMMGVHADSSTAGTVTATGRAMNGAFSVADSRFGGGMLGVLDPDGPAGAVIGESFPTNGRFSLADPRLNLVPATERQGKKYTVTDWTSWTKTVISASTTGQGAFALEDRRIHQSDLLPLGDQAPPRDLGRYQPYGVVPTDQPARTVTGEAAPGAGPFSFPDDLGIAGVRLNNVWRVVRVEDHAQAVTGGGGPSSGAQSFPDMRFNLERGDTNFRNSHYRVVGDDEVSKAVIAGAHHDRGAFTVADRRLPAPNERLDPPPVIISPHSGCWHRPFTTYELAMLQSLPTHFPDWSRTLQEPGAPLVLDASAPLELPGKSDSQWRTWIGNMVPVLAAKAIAEEMLHSLELSHTGQTFELRGNGEIWVERIEQRQARVAALMSAMT